MTNSKWERLLTILTFYSFLSIISMRKKTLLKKPFICNFTLQKQYCNKNDRTLVFSVSFSFVKAVGVGVNLVKKKKFLEIWIYLYGQIRASHCCFHNLKLYSKSFHMGKKTLNIISQQSITELSVQLCVKHFVTRFYSIQNAVLFTHTVAVNSVVCINTSLILGRPSVSLHTN